MNLDAVSAELDGRDGPNGLKQVVVCPKIE